MTSDLIQWAQDSPIGVGETPGVGLLGHATQLPGVPDPRDRKPRHRPNRGRKRRFVGPFLETPPWDLLHATGYPIPSDLMPLDRVPSCWRRGPMYHVWRLEVHAMWGHECHICGHEGAHTADHLVPLSMWGNQPYDPRLSRPAHGIDGCPTCHVKCNSSRGNRQLGNQIRDYKPAVAL